MNIFRGQVFRPLSRKFVIAPPGGHLETLVDACKLMLELSFTTKMCEQAHGSAACLRKLHDYEQRTLQRRTLVHQCRALWRQSDVEKQAARIQRQLDRLNAAVPGRIGGRHMFLKDLSLTASSRLSERTGRTAMWGHGMRTPRRSPCDVMTFSLARRRRQRVMISGGRSAWRGHAARPSDSPPL